MSATGRLPRPRHRWYAFLYDKLIEPSGKKLIQPIRRDLAGRAHGRVLEIGAGTGANLPFYDWAHIDSLEMTEPDPFMARRIQPRLEALPSDARAKVRVHEAPAEQLPFEDAEFDSALVTLVLCSVIDVDASLAELARVLKPGAQVLLLEHIKASGAWANVQNLIQPVYGWTAAGCRLDRDTETALRRAGFDLDVEKRFSLGGPIFPSFVGIARKAAGP